MVPRPRNGLSLCAGGAGLDMGLGLAEPGFHTRCFVESEEYPRSVLIAAQQAGYLAPAPIWDDLTTFDARPIAGAIDTLLAGYPCQPLSAAGQRKGESDERHLWPDVARVARELGDALNWIFLENVAGHVSLGAEAVLRELLSMGFTPAAGLFSAQEIGATHERLRWFCVAYRASGGQRERENAAQPGRGGHADGGDLDLEDAIGAGTGSGEPDAGERGRDTLGGRRALLRRGDRTIGPDRIATDGEGDRSNLDHTAGARRDPAGQRAGSDSQGGERLSGAGRDELADASGARPQRREQRGSPDQWDRPPAPRSTAERGSLPLFPPGPKDSAAWAAVLAMAPGLAPSISVGDIARQTADFAKMAASRQLEETQVESELRQVADGMAARTRTLRLLGNGVCPLAAAHAWRTLGSAHGLRRLDLGAANRRSETRADEPALMEATE